MTRKQAREEAFILVFEKEFNDNGIEDILEAAAEAQQNTSREAVARLQALSDQLHRQTDSEQ